MHAYSWIYGVRAEATAPQTATFVKLVSSPVAFSMIYCDHHGLVIHLLCLSVSPGKTAFIQYALISWTNYAPGSRDARLNRKYLQKGTCAGVGFTVLWDSAMDVSSHQTFTASATLGLQWKANAFLKLTFVL